MVIMELRKPFLLGCCLVLALGCCCVPSARAYLNVAHMVNTDKALNWAVDTQGANAVEMDLVFEADRPTKFQHGGICDCSCYFAQQLFFQIFSQTLVPLDSSNVCSPLSFSCAASSDATTQLNLVATKKTVALVYIDSKIDKISGVAGNEVIMRLIGSRAWVLLRTALLEKGYNGKLLVGVPEAKYWPYLHALLTSAQRDPSPTAKAFLAAKRLMLTIDGDSYNSVVPKLKEFKANNMTVVYSRGISACAPQISYFDDIKKAVAEGIFNEILIWTLDRSSSMTDYINAGVTGIVTNKPIIGYNTARKQDMFTKRTPEDVLPATPVCSGALSGGGVWGGDYCSGCDCNYVNKGLFKRSGCAISEPPPANTACKCIYRGAWTCGGEVVPCSDSTSPFCKSPGYDKNTCQQGRGDCDGY
ncbi:hypothetical protein PLESTB_001345600 [Pleodorina starrii]|uniref:Glycerophosphodiester phosphodiesterase n=1 Tax=Pleodorina starrii TaxID=330485 RepID=A0A9W6BTS2_9CHLO|nr:hypothetical protein PLESTB_001345600 [Pleodorina starrii]